MFAAHVLVLILVTFGLIAPAHALTAEQRCVVSKLGASGRAFDKTLHCQGRAAQHGNLPNPACSLAAHDRITAQFNKAQSRGGCAGTGDEATVHEEIVDFADEMVSAFGAPFSPCAAAKLRALGRAGARALDCHARSVRTAADVDAACLSEVAARLTAAFARAERRPACVTQGDASGAASAVGSEAAALASMVETGSPPDDAPFGLAAAISGGTIHLTWINPEPSSGNTHVKLLRRLNAPPASADDAAADVVFSGMNTSANDDLTALLPDTSQTARTYHYAVFGCTAGAACETIGSRTLLAPTVSEVLRGGGYVVHWRHAAADVCSDRTDLGTAATTSVPDWWKSCDAQCPPAGAATARQMNATGVTQSTTIGDAFRTRGFPVGRVVSSEFCRNVSTAELMDFGPAIEQSPSITFFVYDEASRCQNSYALLAEAPAPGTNTAVIGHAGFSCAVLGTLAWGEGAIFKPDGTGGAVFVQSVLWDGWPSLP